MDVERKNYSFYMPLEFDSNLRQIQDEDKKLAALSKSQAVNYIITEISNTGKFEIDRKN